MSRLIDADELKKMFPDKGEGAWTYNITAKAYIDAAPTVDQWHYPSRGEYPTDRGWYLGVFKEVGTGWVNPVPFICEYVGKQTKVTTKEGWILAHCTDVDNPIKYYANLVCVMWMSLPGPPEEEV